MKTLVIDEGKIKCLITGKLRRGTPEEYVRQEFTRVLLGVYKYPKAHIDVEFPIKIGVQAKWVDIAVFNNEIKSQDNIYLVVETKSKQRADGIEQLYSYMSSTTASFGVWTNGQEIIYLLKETGIPIQYP
jgi:type I restriction enzyme M protein